MSLTSGAISQVSVGSQICSLSCTAASGGTGPYTYQWYYSTTTGFSPSGANDIVGATSLTLSMTGLIPNTVYYFKVVSTDTGNSNVTVTSTQLAVTTAVESLSQNQFNLVPTLGQVDLPYNFNTVAVQIDSTQAVALYPGAPVKIVDNAGGVPKVIACSASTDECFGFINFNIKNLTFSAGQPVEISQAGNVMFLYATGAIARGAQVTLDVANNGVAEATGSSTYNIVGFAYDKATGPGQLIRVKLACPSFLID